MNYHKRIKRLMAYVYMPLIFTVLGYLVIYIAIKPIVDVAVSVTTMVMAKEIPNFNLDLVSIYEDPTDNKVLQNYVRVDTGEHISVVVNADGTVVEQKQGGSGTTSSPLIVRKPDNNQNTDATVKPNDGGKVDSDSNIISDNPNQNLPDENDTDENTPDENIPDGNDVNPNTPIDGQDTDSENQESKPSDAKNEANTSVDNGASVVLPEDSYYVDVESVKWPYYGEHYAQIYCDRIGLDAPIYMGDNYMLLRNGVGQYLGSYIPGYGKPIMLAAHSTTFFAPLEHIKEGDVVCIKTSYGIYKYQVSGTKICKPEDSSAYNLESNREQLIMYTCYPFKLLSGSRRRRLFVYAEKISGPALG